MSGLIRLLTSEPIGIPDMAWLKLIVVKDLIDMSCFVMLNKHDKYVIVHTHEQKNTGNIGWQFVKLKPEVRLNYLRHYHLMH